MVAILKKALVVGNSCGQSKKVFIFVSEPWINLLFGTVFETCLFHYFFLSLLGSKVRNLDTLLIDYFQFSVFEFSHLDRIKARIRITSLSG